MLLTPPDIAAWLISAAAILLILVRPRGISEWIWAVSGAAVLVALRLVSLPAAGAAAARGINVYLFLAGMMALSELARAEGVFDWLASGALRAAAGSKARLFWLVYGVGTVVTALLSNDATAVVLTPAVYAAIKRTNAKPLPFLYACAFVANAASFVLPISNPANLVVFANRLPRLAPWLAAFALPAAVAVVLTGALLFFCERRRLRGAFRSNGRDPQLAPPGRVALAAVLASAAVLVAAAALGKPIGIVSFALGTLATLAVALADPQAPRTVARHVTWSVIPLVAALFVIVQGLDASGALQLSRVFLLHASAAAPIAGNLLIGGVVALACNLLNNLPVGLIAGYTLGPASAAPHIASATLVAVDLSPNLSVTGSLATLLWLISLRRDGVEVTPWQFLRTGAVVLLPTLLLTMASVH